jgi:hypothetical protein
VQAKLDQRGHPTGMPPTAEERHGIVNLNARWDIDSFPCGPESIKDCLRCLGKRRMQATPDCCQYQYNYGCSPD